MQADLAALWYLEYRQTVNRVRETIRRPGRALIYVFAIGYFIFSGIMRSRGHIAGVAMHAVPEPYAGVLMFAYVTLLGVVCYGAASGIVGAFASTADARFLTGSLLSERTVVVWLQLRRCASGVLRMLFSLILYMIVFSRSGTFSGIGFAVVGGTIVATAAAIPMLKMRVVAGARPAQSLAAAIAAAGILPMVILLSTLISRDMMHTASAIEGFGAGAAFNALLNGNTAALLALYAFAAGLIALSFALGEGLYPDLYAASLRLIAHREKQRRGGTAAFNMEHRYERRSFARRTFFDRLSGPWTIVWKEWIAFVRSSSMQRIFVLGLLACAAGGAILGNVAAHSHDPLGETIAFSSMAANAIVIFVAMGSAIGLGGDLSKPLWWMGPDPLWMRLFAWITGTSWRLAACLAIGLAAWSAAMHLPAVALAGIPIALAAVCYLRAVGLALYAIFPSSIDQRGPLAMVRALLTYVLAAPPIVVGVVTGVLLRSVGAGIAVAIVTSIAETFGLIAFASARISGRGIAFAQAESM